MLSEIVPATRLTMSDRRRLYELLERHYEHVSWPQFEADLLEKDAVIVLRDESGLPCGFSTQKVIEITVTGIPVRAIFSGDTIIDPNHWGEQELGRAWCRYVGRVRAADPGTPLYWFLISKGYRTYLYLPVFFKTYYPASAWSTPAAEQRILNALASTKFPEDYDAKNGLVVFPESRGHLKPELAVVPPHRLKNQHVQFFLSSNPSYSEGTELACLAEISPENMRSYPARILQEEELKTAGLQVESVHA
ncbi:MAG TPA: hypothetical protein VMO76_10715 [Candidatus Udaeobacter sp.]|nr:hypothetical protein [Candidatus Udaeobacter sp.]